MLDTTLRFVHGFGLGIASSRLGHPFGWHHGPIAFPAPTGRRDPSGREAAQNKPRFNATEPSTPQGRMPSPIKRSIPLIAIDNHNETATHVAQRDPKSQRRREGGRAWVRFVETFTRWDVGDGGKKITEGEGDYIGATGWWVEFPQGPHTHCSSNADEGFSSHASMSPDAHSPLAHIVFPRISPSA